MGCEPLKAQHRDVWGSAPWETMGRSVAGDATAVRGAVARRIDWLETAQLVASELERHLPSARILTAEQQAGDPETFRSHVLHSALAGSAV